MINETDSKWLTWAIFLHLSVLSCLLVMPLLPFIQDIFKLLYLIIIGWFRSMSTIFRRWKNRLRCSSKRYIHRSRSSIIADNEFKTVNVTIEKLSHENQLLKERFEKLEERCQQWITDEQIYLLKRIEQLEEDNRRLHETSQQYQKQSEKCLESVTDLIIKTLFTQEELRKQCTDLHHVIDTVQLRKKVQQNASTTRSVSCQYPSNHSNENHRHTTDDQSTWLHQQLVIVEENDPKPANQQVSELHITESQSSVCSPTMATGKYKSRIPSIGLANELYFSSHKPDGDQEKTPPVPLRSKRRSPHLDHVSVDNRTPSMSNNRRPISSPVRSTTYVLQQHHRIANNNNHNHVNTKTCSSPVHQQPSMTLNRNRQTQQQRTFSNHERLPADSSTTTPQFPIRAQIALTPRRTSPIVKTTPTKPATTTTTPSPSYISRSPRIPNTPPVRPSRPMASSSPATQQRAPRVQLRPPNLTPTTQRTVSSSPTTSKAIPRHQTPSKASEQLRPITGTVTVSRPAHMLVNKSKMRNSNATTHNIKTRTPTIVPPSTARVSDLDALMEQKHVTTPKKPPNVQLKSSVIAPSPIANHFRRSLFSADSVKVVRPVRSQELKIFSSHLTTEQPSSSLPPIVSDELSNMTETLSTLTSASFEPKFENKSPDDPKINVKSDDSSSNTSVLLRDLSEDSLNSLNEHYHIRQLLKSNASVIATKNDSTQNNSSNDDIPVTSWSRIRSSCESNISHIAPLPNELSASPAFYKGPVRQENIQMASDGRYFLLIDENLSSEENQISPTSSRSRSASPLIKPSVALIERKSFAHRLVFPARLGRIIFYRRVLSDSDIYQKLCSKDNEINHNVYHLDTVRDYAMEFYMLTTYGSDSQLRAWFGHQSDDLGNNTCYFDDNRFQSFDDDDDDEEEERRTNRLKRTDSSDSIIRTDDFNRIQADEELDWYSELESFNFLPNNQQWKQENVSSCSSDDHVGDLLRAEQFSVSSLTTTTSADSSSSTGLISASWPLTNGIHYQVHSDRSSQSLGSPQLSHTDDQSHTILKEILTYPWTNDLSTPHLNPPPEAGTDTTETGPSSSSVVSEEFQPDFYYLCPLKNTTSFRSGDEKTNGLSQKISHDV